MAGNEPLNLGTEGEILYDANKKSKLVAYLLWFFIGAFGAHRLYARRVKSGLAQLAMWVGGFGLMMAAMWPAMQTTMEAAKKAAESGQPMDPAAPPPEAAAAMEAAVTDPTYLIGMALLGVFAIWWIVDAFLIPGWIRRHNETLVASLRGR